MPTSLDYFQMEAAERLERVSSGLLALEQSPGDESLIGDLFREAHSLKGAAGVSGLTDVAEICHKMEDLLDGVRGGSDQVDGPMIDALLAATDALEKMIAATADQADCDVVPADIIAQLGKRDTSTPANVVAATKPGGGDANVEVPTAKSEGVEPDAGHTSATEHVAPEVTAPAHVTDTVRLSVDMLDTLGNRTGELMVAGDRLRQRLSVARALHRLIRNEHQRHQNDHTVQQVLQPIATATRQLIDELTTDFTVIEPLIAEIHEGVLDTRMVPLSVLYDRLPRFVRDHCREQNTQAELKVEGADIRVDRQVLEQLRDPMIHLVRNALSHGIESPEAREKCGKNPVGTLCLATSRRGDRIRITCEDDGRGIDRQAVLAKALAKGLITKAEATELSASQIERLILRPGFSTAEIITDVSGRGVGMDVVLSRMDALQGTLNIETGPGKFTRFVLEFPASVASLEGLLVEAAGITYVVPTASVVQTGGVRVPELQTGAGGEVIVNIEGQAVPLLMLASLMGRARDGGEALQAIPFVVVRHRERQIALGVDRLVGTQTIIGKGLGDHIRNVRGLAGATILGTGVPALILEPGQLVQDGGRGLTRHEMPGCTANVEEHHAPLLVVDDSLTTRMMEESILKASGYAVDTAVSAEDALSKVEDSTYRLFVLDVEMPGLNGFQLTRRLRQDERFADTPIIIVSSLAKEEHRREGLEAGANAYIVKGEFDQNNLLDTVERLVNQ